MLHRIFRRMHVPALCVGASVGVLHVLGSPEAQRKAATPRCCWVQSNAYFNLIFTTTIFTPPMAKPQSANDDRSSKYRRLTQVEHVAHRAAMYLGSTSVEQTMQWVATRESDTIIVACKEISFVPALYKLYDEVVTLRQRTTR